MFGLDTRCLRRRCKHSVASATASSSRRWRLELRRRQRTRRLDRLRRRLATALPPPTTTSTTRRNPIFSTTRPSKCRILTRHILYKTCLFTCGSLIKYLEWHSCVYVQAEEKSEEYVISDAQTGPSKRKRWKKRKTRKRKIQSITRKAGLEKKYEKDEKNYTNVCHYQS